LEIERERGLKGSGSSWHTQSSVLAKYTVHTRGTACDRQLRHHQRSFAPSSRQASGTAVDSESAAVIVAAIECLIPGGRRNITMSDRGPLPSAIDFPNQYTQEPYGSGRVAVSDIAQLNFVLEAGFDVIFVNIFQNGYCSQSREETRILMIIPE
jgi:hypothetical protein